MQTRYKIGLALGSGAARGWAHIGVINRLRELGIEPDVVCGTSIGALVGAAYATGNLSVLDDWVRQLGRLETARYFTFDGSFRGFVNKERFTRFLVNYVTPAEREIDALDLVYGSVATDLGNGREIWNTQGRVIDAIWSSISLPGLFPAIRHNDRWLIDGGLVNPVPVSLCRALGADIVIAVNLNSDIVGRHLPALQTESIPSRDRQPDAERGLAGRIGDLITDYTNNLFGNNQQEKLSEAPSLLDAIAASINITQDRITRSRMAGDPPDILLNPRLARIGLLEFYRGSDAITEGRRSVDRHRDELERLLGIERQ